MKTFILLLVLLPWPMGCVTMQCTVRHDDGRGTSADVTIGAEWSPGPDSQAE